jgi:hypothetical protein
MLSRFESVSETNVERELSGEIPSATGVPPRVVFARWDGSEGSAFPPPE